MCIFWQITTLMSLNALQSYLLLNQILQVLAILDRIKDENENKNAPSGASDNNDQSDDDGDWEGDDPDDEGIIYVK